VSVSAEGQPNVVAAAFLEPGNSLQIVLVDDQMQGSSPLGLRIDVGAGMGQARVLRLTAPSQSATAGVLLGGHEVSAAGSLRAQAHPQSISTHAGILSVELDPASAELLTVSARTTTTRRRG
jgi:hypothetical protein